MLVLQCLLRNSRPCHKIHMQDTNVNNKQLLVALCVDNYLTLCWICHAYWHIIVLCKMNYFMHTNDNTKDERHVVWFFAHISLCGCHTHPGSRRCRGGKHLRRFASRGGEPCGTHTCCGRRGRATLLVDFEPVRITKIKERVSRAPTKCVTVKSFPSRVYILRSNNSRRLQVVVLNKKTEGQSSWDRFNCERSGWSPNESYIIMVILTFPSKTSSHNSRKLLRLRC